MLVCLSVFAAHLVGCGDGGTATPNGERQQVEQGTSQRPPAEIPKLDRTAFYGIATVSGSLRLSAAPVALGQTDRPANRAELVAARHRVAALRPRDPQLSTLRAKLSAALAIDLRPVHGLAAIRQAARRALHATGVINAGLRSYAARHPATAALIPD
jgi:hypothetical protein